jgi:AcrR family transcriptional regulator
MSLYRYVPDKDALVSMMVDEVIGSAPGPRGPDDLPPHWRDALRQIAEVIWTVCQDHPWYAEAVMLRPPLTPNGAAGLETCLAIFDGYDVDMTTKMLFVAMTQYAVIGAALNNLIEGRNRDRLDMTEEEVMNQGVPFIKAMAASGRYPRVMEFIVGAEHLSEKEEVMRNVELILDGIATRLP